MAKPVWLEVDGKKIEAMPWSNDGDYLARGNEPETLNGIYPSNEGYWRGMSAIKLAPGDSDEILAAMAYFWPIDIFQRFTAMVAKMFNGAGDVTPKTSELAQFVLAEPVICEGSICAETAKKQLFYGSRAPTNEQAIPKVAKAMADCDRAKQRIDTTNPAHMAKLHAILGITGEAHEVLIEWDNPEKLKLELGDVVFYVQALAALSGFGLKEILEANIEKLETRYPEGWPKS